LEMHPSLAPGKRSWPPIEEMATMYPCVLSRAGSAALWESVFEERTRFRRCVWYDHRGEGG